MSASYLVDPAQTLDYPGSISTISGQNTIVGNIVDMLHANTYTGVWVAGLGSGPIQIQIQTSDDTVSGNYTDPTSGLAAFPVNVVSGGIFWANSGLYGSGNYSPAAPVSGACLLASGGITFCSFQRPQRYARLLAISGNVNIGLTFTAGFIGQKKTVFSGGGFSYSPTSGSVNV
jgi:hypothetical protein